MLTRAVLQIFFLQLTFYGFHYFLEDMHQTNTVCRHPANCFDKKVKRKIYD